MYIAWGSFYDNITLKQSNEKFVFLLYDNLSLTQVVKFKIKLGLSFMVPDCVYKFQIICLQGTYVSYRQGNKKPKLSKV